MLHALRDQYLLQLDEVYTDLFIIPPASLELARRLLDGDQPTAKPVHKAVHRLMRELSKLTLHPCVKGPFHDAMQAKLEQLARTRSNKVTSLDFDMSPVRSKHDSIRLQAPRDAPPFPFSEIRGETCD